MINKVPPLLGTGFLPFWPLLWCCGEKWWASASEGYINVFTCVLLCKRGSYFLGKFTTRVFLWGGRLARWPCRAQTPNCHCGLLLLRNRCHPVWMWSQVNANSKSEMISAFKDFMKENGGLIHGGFYVFIPNSIMLACSNYFGHSALCT